MKVILRLLMAIFIVGCSGKPYVVKPGDNPDASGVVHRMYVVSHGWHTGIVISAHTMNALVPELGERFGDAPYYELGWGDKGFYQAQEITLGLALQAMFNSEGSVMHVVALPETPVTFFAQSEVHALCINDAQLASLARFLAQSFARDGNGKLQSLQRGIYGNSQFYAAEGRYHMLHTCNSWASKGLLSAGVDIETSLTAEGVMGGVRKSSQQCAVTTVFAK